MENPTILVADDNADDVELLRRAFSKAGFGRGLHAVRGGQQVIEYLKGEENMVGHKLGEFAPTRLFRGHGGKLSADKRAAAAPGGAPAAAPSGGGGGKPAS